MSTLEVEKMRANAKLREEKARLVHLRQQEHSQGLKIVQEVWVPLTVVVTGAKIECVINRVTAVSLKRLLQKHTSYRAEYLRKDVFLDWLNFGFFEKFC